jgi:hypothetical protein
MAEELTSREKTALDFARAAKRSTYTMVGGSPTNFYMDVDEYVLGKVEDYYDPDAARGRRSYIRENVVPEILDLAVKYSIGRLAFLEKKDAGPIGLLTIMSQLLEDTGLEACIVRPKKRVFLAGVKGRAVRNGERLMLLSDIATTGLTISLAARTLRRLGAIVPVAYVFYDRKEGASDILALEDIELVSHLDPTTESRAENKLLA